MRWEYLTVQLRGDGAYRLYDEDFCLEPDVDGLGSDGWELGQVLRSEPDEEFGCKAWVVFRRELKEECAEGA